MWRSFSVGLFVGLLCFSAASVSAQDDTARARAAFTNGVEAYESGNYQHALEQFQSAYRLRPHPSVRINMANCYEQLNRPVEAIEHYERFLADSENVDETKAAEVRGSIERLRRQVGEIFVRVQPDGAMVSIDNAESRRAPILDSIALPAGAHTVTVEMEGFRTERREINVVGGSRGEVRVNLRPGSNITTATNTATNTATTATNTATTATNTITNTTDTSDTDSVDRVNQVTELDPSNQQTIDLTDPADPSDNGPRFFNTPAITTTLLSVGFGAGSVICALLANQSDADFEDAVLRSNNSALGLPAQQAAHDEGVEFAATARRRALLADIFGGVAVVGLGLTAYFLFVWDGDEEEEEAQLTMSPWMTGESGGVSLQGSF